jgi:hypothetical protein
VVRDAHRAEVAGTVVRQTKEGGVVVDPPRACVSSGFDLLDRSQQQQYHCSCKEDAAYPRPPAHPVDLMGLP